MLEQDFKDFIAGSVRVNKEGTFAKPISAEIVKENRHMMTSSAGPRESLVVSNGGS